MYKMDLVKLLYETTKGGMPAAPRRPLTRTWMKDRGSVYLQTFAHLRDLTGDTYLIVVCIAIFYKMLFEYRSIDLRSYFTPKATVDGYDRVIQTLDTLFMLAGDDPLMLGLLRRKVKGISKWLRPPKGLFRPDEPIHMFNTEFSARRLRERGLHLPFLTDRQFERVYKELSGTLLRSSSDPYVLYGKTHFILNVTLWGVHPFASSPRILQILREDVRKTLRQMKENPWDDVEWESILSELVHSYVAFGGCARDLQVVMKRPRSPGKTVENREQSIHIMLSYLLAQAAVNKMKKITCPSSSG